MMSEFSQEQIDKNRRRWIEALRSGKFRQGKRLLENLGTNSYCCLGVACKLLGDEIGIVRKEIEPQTRTGKPRRCASYDKTSGLLPQAMVKYLGLLSRGGAHIKMPHNLSTLNDLGMSFNTIADELESGKYWIENKNG